VDVWRRWRGGRLAGVESGMTVRFWSLFTTVWCFSLCSHAACPCSCILAPLSLFMSALLSSLRVTPLIICGAGEGSKERYSALKCGAVGIFFCKLSEEAF